MDLCLFVPLLVAFSLFQEIGANDRNNQVREACGANEEYAECGSACPFTCENYQQNFFCAKPCVKGCVCRPEYVRGPSNTCILPQQCPIGPCEVNEVVSDCASPCNTCENRGRCYTEYCTRACDCIPGLFRNSSGTCVREQFCDYPVSSLESACPRNEISVPCVNECNDCYNRGHCGHYYPYCLPGCDCKPGYFRDDDGNCIPESQCMFSGCGENEQISECVVPCNDCMKRGNCSYICDYGCDCKAGFYRNRRNICVLASQCPPLVTTTTAYPASGIIPRKCVDCDRCQNNEQFYVCKPTCKNTCLNYNNPSVSCFGECKSGCFCKEGLIKNENGECIHPKECPTGKKTKPTGISPRKCVDCDRCMDNEQHVLCLPTCKNTCENYNDSNVPCFGECKSGCSCKEGLIKNSDGECVKPEQCPKGNQLDDVTTQKANIELFKVSFPDKMTSPTSIIPRKCVDCNGCPDNEEFYMCIPTCKNSCINYNDSSLPCFGACKSGCSCKEGLIRSSDGGCVKPEQCPEVNQLDDVATEKANDEQLLIQVPVTTPVPIPPCPDDEQFQPCIPTCKNTCMNYNDSSVPCSGECKSGCFCKEGHVRNSDAECVKPEQCPKVCPPNEEYNTCGSSCPLSCSNLGKAISCIQKCVPGCFCKSGFVRGSDNRCIRANLCPSEPTKCPAGEIFEFCKKTCMRTCDTINGQTCKPEENCTPGCACKPNLFRKSDGACVHLSECLDTRRIDGRSRGSKDKRIGFTELQTTEANLIISEDSTFRSTAASENSDETTSANTVQQMASLTKLPDAPRNQEKTKLTLRSHMKVSDTTKMPTNSENSFDKKTSENSNTEWINTSTQRNQDTINLITATTLNDFPDKTSFAEDILVSSPDSSTVEKEVLDSNQTQLQNFTGDSFQTTASSNRDTSTLNMELSSNTDISIENNTLGISNTSILPRRLSIQNIEDISSSTEVGLENTENSSTIAEETVALEITLTTSDDISIEVSTSFEMSDNSTSSTTVTETTT